ncbi:protein of unknown function [Clostridium beijerinckii]|nr:protein of unknown function [Clostridium beijerinckii]
MLKMDSFLICTDEYLGCKIQVMKYLLRRFKNGDNYLLFYWNRKFA